MMYWSKPLMPDGAVVALDVGVLLRLARLDVRQGDAIFLSPLQLDMADVFRPVARRKKRYFEVMATRAVPR